jgi:hypothetical protein
VALYCEECVRVYTHSSDCVEDVHELPLLPNNTASETFLHKSGGVRFIIIYYWGAGLAVTGRMRDIGQNVLQFSFQPGNSSSPAYSHILFLIALFEENLYNYSIYY